MSIVRKGIPLFRPIGEPFYMGSSDENKMKFTLSKGFLIKHIPIGQSIKLYSDYYKCENIDDLMKYIKKVLELRILKSVYLKIGEDAATISGIMGDKGIYIDIDDSTFIGKKLLDVLDKNMVFATLLYQIDSSYRDEIVGIETVALCLGCIENSILFI